MSSRHRSLLLLREREPRWRSALSLLALLLLALALLLLTALPARADDTDALPTASPYFFVPDGDPGVDRLPLKSTRVDVLVLGPIAGVTVTQRYRNEGQRPIDARYVFPGGTAAAVHAMTVRIGERVLAADIREKQAARIEFQQAKREGKTAALLEQQRPNVFQMNVANILPGDEVQVELRYTELLVPRESQYEFVFPTVVGPRYNSPQGEARTEQWIAQPVLREGQRPNHALELNVSLRTPVPVAHLESPSHRIEVLKAGEQQLEVALGGDERPHNNRDFILRLRLAGDAIDSGVLLYQGRGSGKDDAENFFLAMVEPPAVVEAAAVLPRELIFVVDISGSMHGFPLDTAKTLMDGLLRELRPIDSFNVLLFSGSARTLASESLPATEANIAVALSMLRQTAAGGGTEIVPALKRIASMPKRDDVSRSVVVVTDGYVAVEREVFELVRKHLAAANVFAFGIGSSVNRHLIEGIARAGQGEAFVVTQPKFAAEQARRFRRMLDAPLLTHATARFEGGDFEPYDVEPRALPDLLAHRPLVLWGKWNGRDIADAKLVVEGRTAGGSYRQVVPLAGAVSRDTPALRQLWARARIGALADDEALQGRGANRERITALGLKYSLLTDYTSFIAVDRLVRNTSGDSVAVDQPSPLPEGVSKHAVGAALPSTPEPAAWAAAALMLCVAAFALRRRSAALTR